MCKHDISMLMGTKDGIVCRNCGAVFTSMAEIKPPEEKPKRARKKANDGHDKAPSA